MGFREEKKKKKEPGCQGVWSPIGQVHLLVLPPVVTRILISTPVFVARAGSVMGHHSAIVGIFFFFWGPLALSTDGTSMSRASPSWIKGVGGNKIFVHVHEFI